jgi:phosphoribosylformylglycinamidine synthase
MIYRIDVRTAPSADGTDPVGESVRQQIAEFGTQVGPILASRVFLIDTDASPLQIDRVARELLADPIVELAEVVAQGRGNDDTRSRIEIHLKPGVMDPVATSTEMALRDMGVPVREVRTGRAYGIAGHMGRDELQKIASRALANGVIESVHFERFIPEKFQSGHEYRLQLRHVALRELTDEQLARLSREGHLFLSPAEMKAIQSYYREQGREPTDIELETLAQTWSEHCVHKTLKSSVDVEQLDGSGRVISTRHYDNLIKETIFASTMELMAAARDTEPFCLSVFKDNAGVVAFDEADAVCFKVETHNHPSAIEPYGGSATGIGGVIRDILGTGLAAKPVANTDVFCVAFTDAANPSAVNPLSQVRDLPKGVIHPRRILQQIVAGVRDYGNRMGIPTVNGAVYFDDRYLGNPLVFCGCVGLIPRNRVEKESHTGDAVVVMGGRTGRDGIHGATFSSAELTDTHADEFSHAVQIGNAITEKKVTDVILQARDRELFTAVTDCGAGGLSSAVGEMAEKIGATVELDKVPLKYAGLRYDEIWISEAQERMVLSVPPGKLGELLELAAAEDVEATVIGTFGNERRELVLNYRGTEVGRLSTRFLHHGIPMPRRKAVVTAPSVDSAPAPSAANKPAREQLLGYLAHPNIASKHWVIRQYDHEVQGGSVVKPLVGPLQVGPSDAAVVRPKLSSRRGVAIGCGLAPHIADPYAMAIASIDEAIRNVVAVGADPDMVAILDNFCWPSVDDERTMGDLVRTCEACRDAALAYGIPFISGKDSLHNQFTDTETGRVIRIPNTLLISAIGVIEDVARCVTMDLKQAGNAVCLIAPSPGRTDLKSLGQLHRAAARLIKQGLVAACHDVSDGGLLTAVAEMCIASGLGVKAEMTGPLEEPFAELIAAYVVEIAPADLATARGLLPAGSLTPLGEVTDTASLCLDLRGAADVEVSVDELTRAWRGTLDW